MRRWWTAGLVAVLALGVSGTAVGADAGEVNHPHGHRAAHRGTSDSGDLSRHPAMPAQAAAVDAAYGHLPVAFEANTGQSDPRVRYLAHGAGYTLFVTDHESVLALHTPIATKTCLTGRARLRGTGSCRGHGLVGMLGAGRRAPVREKIAVLRLRPLGATAHPRVRGQGRLPQNVNYLIGRRSADWRTGIATYSRAVTQ